MYLQKKFWNAIKLFSNSEHHPAPFPCVAITEKIKDARRMLEENPCLKDGKMNYNATLPGNSVSLGWAWQDLQNQFWYGCYIYKTFMTIKKHQKFLTGKFLSNIYNMPCESTN